MSNKNIEAAYPLSPMQQGMLFHTIYAPESGMYFEQLSCTFVGNLNVAAFQRAWQQVVDRNPVLRTAFVWKNVEKPLQVVGRRVSLPWQQYDWQGLSSVEQQEKLEIFLQTDRTQNFQLSKAPLIRLTLIQLSETVYQFVCSFHHILLDGWSLSLVFKEVFDFYEAFSQGQDLHLKRSRPYQDYIAWLQQQDISQAEAFWRSTLKGFIAPTPLGVDKAFANFSKEESYGVQQIHLSAAVTEELQSFAREHHLTLNTLVQGAWALLLGRYSGQQDVVFGTTVSGRPADLVDVESMVGIFINTLPIRVQVSPAASVWEWLKQLQTQQFEMRQYEYSSLIDVQGWSDVPRGLPLFESIVVFENYPVDASLEKQGSLELCNVRSFERTNYPLTLVAEPSRELSLELSYDCRRFDALTISRMLGHLQTLLEGMVTHANKCLSDLSLLTPVERHTLLVDWNDTQVEYPNDRCIHQVFEAQVERTPDAIAVVYKNQQLTYSQLNNRANQLAHYLQKLGVKSESLVGICVERSLDMVVGLLGILKAGAAYLPLDPAYPQERLSFMLEDAQVSVLLTQQPLVNNLPEYQGKVIQLDTDWEIIGQQSTENLTNQVTPDNLAYVIYTSGSTGKPKGVEVVHRGVNRLLFGVNYVHLDATQRFLQLAPISFDASTFEIWGALLHGAKCVLFPGTIPTSQSLREEIDKHGITVLWLTAALFNSIIDDDATALSGIKQLLIGGEALSVAHVQRAYENLPSTQIINGYGPTENTTFTCCYPIPRKLDKSIKSIFIGRAIANTQVYILDEHLQPVPVGVPGELYIGGAGLARGYLNRPELNSERFISNPFSNETESRLYKTGDLVRYYPDGNIEFLGRIDRQVKLRGFRIELGEIETALSQYPSVQQSVVLLREDTPGDKRLVAYVVSQTTAPTISELQQFLKQKLPEYMVPSAFVILETFPLTPNGKLDLRSLPIPDTSRLGLANSFVSPRDTLELQLVQIWKEILNVQNFGVQDNFFDLGGHSLLALKLIDRIQQKFGKNLSLAELLQYPTIEHLASLIRQQANSLSWSTVVAIQPNGFKPPLFCVHPGAGTVLSYVDLANYLGSEQPFYGLESLGVHEQQPYIQVEDMAAHYIKAMRTVQPQGPYLLCGWCFGGLVAFEMAQQLLAQGQQVSFLALLDIAATGAGEEADKLDDAAFLVRLLAEDVPLSLDYLRQLSTDEQLVYVIEQLRQCNLLPPDFGLPQAQRLLRTFTSHIRATTTYVPQPYPGRVTLFRASEEAVLDDQDLTLGWQELASGGVDLHWVPGNHLSMVREPHVPVLAEKLGNCLEQVKSYILQK